MFPASLIRKAVIAALWFMFLTFPILVVKVNTIEHTIVWRWMNLIYAGVAAFAGVMVLGRRHLVPFPDPDPATFKNARWVRIGPLPHGKAGRSLMLAAGLALGLGFPVFGQYQLTIVTTALMYVILGLGLNIAVGLAGLLHLGYMAFYAIGAYTYALLNLHFGFSFWAALPLGGLTAALFGVVLGIPVLRLKGDYLAIVTLGFGEITRIVLENFDELTNGPSGIANIPGPAPAGIVLSPEGHITCMYYIALVLALLTALFTARIQDSRVGRALMAMREDEIASAAMGIDISRTKLTAFSLSSAVAGVAGVVFAAKTGFINPQSFTFMESAIVLSIVVMGGMGSIKGIAIAAVILTLLPEYLKALGDLRMMLFGLIMAAMMIYRPQGLVTDVRKVYRLEREKGA